jgi:acetate---CoA ligase (ADP-forming)
LDKLFNPKSIAIIGASRHSEKIGYQILNNLITGGYKGKIYPVNPEASEIMSLKAYAKVTDIPDAVDLALVVVPAEFVAEVISDCAAKDVSFATIITSGFAEIGPKGKDLQNKITESIKDSKLRIVGPNCLGIFNTTENMNLTFAASKLVKGNVSAVFQSGALGSVSLELAQKYEFGLAKFISLGNKADIEESEIIEYLANDPQTKVIALYVEEITSPEKFFNRAREASKKKPIVLLKGGETKAGARAAFSHTAAMITPSFINSAIFSQANLVVVKTIEEMLSVISILSCEPPVKYKNLGIITNAGGLGILATDAASREGFNLPKIDSKEMQGTNTESFSTVANPLDLTGGAKASDYEKALKYFCADDRFSALMVILTPQTATEIDETARALSKYAKASKPIISSFLGDKIVDDAVEILKKNKIPHFEDPEEGIVALSKVVKYWQRFYSKEDFIDLGTSKKTITHSKEINDGLDIMSEYNILTPVSGIASNEEEAMEIFRKIKASVAVKNISNKVVHKYKAGKVVLNVQNEEFLKETLVHVGYPALIQKMVDSPFEIIIGAKRDSKMGSIITFGWGGIFTEDLKDISAKILPLTETDLDEMIKETKIGQILIRENIDTSKVKDVIRAIAKLMNECEDISEVDLNPIKLTPRGAYCVDARYKLNN